MRRWRRIAGPALAAAVAFVILLGLGTWQVKRLAWKEALIARVNARLDAPPIAAPGPVAWPGLDLADLEYQPVTVHGRYDNGREIDVLFALTEPRGPAGGQGFMVMTPFVTDAGWTVYVNRGFVPADRKDPATRREGVIEGETTVVGLLRQPQTRSWFMPADNGAKNEWFSRAPALYAVSQGLPVDQVAPYLIDARYDPKLPGGLPQGGETLVSFPNSHLSYAITWYGLAAALLGVFAVYALRRLREPPPQA